MVRVPCTKTRRIGSKLYKDAWGHGVTIPVHHDASNEGEGHERETEQPIRTKPPLYKQILALGKGSGQIAIHPAIFQPIQISCLTWLV